eukprot:1170993-Lingulodinium_polyedra.AAC.1
MSRAIASGRKRCTAAPRPATASARMSQCPRRFPSPRLASQPTSRAVSSEPMGKLRWQRTIHTCRFCRAWAKPGPGHVCHVDM